LLRSSETHDEGEESRSSFARGEAGIGDPKTS
jgi:hypothetical protein